jgi:hypothetical protein
MRATEVFKGLLSGKNMKRLMVTSEDPLFKGGDRSKGRVRDMAEVFDRESFQKDFFVS